MNCPGCTGKELLMHHLLVIGKWLGSYGISAFSLSGPDE
jgi:hypothetical protein